MSAQDDDPVEQILRAHQPRAGEAPVRALDELYTSLQPGEYITVSNRSSS